MTRNTGEHEGRSPSSLLLGSTLAASPAGSPKDRRREGANRAGVAPAQLPHCSPKLTPLAQQEPQIRSIDDSVVVEVADSCAAPVAQEDPEVSPIDDVIAVQVGLAATRRRLSAVELDVV